MGECWLFVVIWDCVGCYVICLCGVIDLFGGGG